eukprot:453719-Prymnesium_polylepis.1
MTSYLSLNSLHVFSEKSLLSSTQGTTLEEPGSEAFADDVVATPPSIVTSNRRRIDRVSGGDAASQRPQCRRAAPPCCPEDRRGRSSGGDVANVWANTSCLNSFSRANDVGWISKGYAEDARTCRMPNAALGDVASTRIGGRPQYMLLGIASAFSRTAEDDAIDSDAYYDMRKRRMDRRLERGLSSASGSYSDASDDRPPAARKA